MASKKEHLRKKKAKKHPGKEEESPYGELTYGREINSLDLLSVFHGLTGGEEADDESDATPEGRAESEGSARREIEADDEQRRIEDESAISRRETEEAQRVRMEDQAAENERRRLEAAEADQKRQEVINADRALVAAEEAKRRQDADEETERIRRRAEERERRRVWLEKAEQARLAAESSEQESPPEEEPASLSPTSESGGGDDPNFGVSTVVIHSAAEKAKRDRIAAEHAEKSRKKAADQERRRQLLQMAEQIRLAETESTGEARETTSTVSSAVSAAEPPSGEERSEELDVPEPVENSSDQSRRLSEEQDRRREWAERAERMRRVAEEAELLRRGEDGADQSRREAEEAERTRLADAEAERWHREQEANKQARSQAEAAERALLEAEESERRRREEEAERVRREEEEAAREKLKAEEAEKLRRQAEEAEIERRRMEDAEKARLAAEEERVRCEAAEAERLRLEAVEAERMRREAEEAELARRQAEIEERRLREEEEARFAAEEERKRRDEEAAELARRQAEDAERRRREEEEAERLRREAIAAERQRREAEELELARRRREEEERRRREEEEAEKIRREAEEAERKRREEEAAERARRDAEEAEERRQAAERAAEEERIRWEAIEAERQRREAEAAELARRQAEEAERRRQAEEAERERAAAEEKERLRLEAEAVKEAERQAEEAERHRLQLDEAERLLHEAEQAKRRREAEEALIEQQRIEEEERRRQEADAAERARKMAESATRARRMADEVERARREAEESERRHQEAARTELKRQEDAAIQRAREMAESAENARRMSEEVDQSRREEAGVKSRSNSAHTVPVLEVDNPYWEKTPEIFEMLSGAPHGSTSPSYMDGDRGGCLPVTMPEGTDSGYPDGIAFKEGGDPTPGAKTTVPVPLEKRMYIVMVTPEVAPCAKVGGLGDVVLGLGRELMKRGHGVEVICPMYGGMRYDLIQDLHEEYGELWCPHYGEWRSEKVFQGKVEGGLQVNFITGGNYTERPAIYGYDDDLQRFTYFSRQALEFMYKTNRRPDIIHCHDWATGLVPAILWDVYQKLGWDNSRIVYTIHNNECQGLCGFGDKLLGMVGLDIKNYLLPDKMQDDTHRNCINMMKSGIVFSNFVTTVSPTYASELKTAVGGRGLQNTIAKNSAKVGGVLNGIDYDSWNPQTDGKLATRYSGGDDFHRKYENKKALRDWLGLWDSWKPIVSVVTRLTQQKGLDLIKNAIYMVQEMQGQFVLLGSAPDPKVNAEFLRIQHELKDNHDVNLYIGYHEDLSRLIYAGSDMFLIPSLYEPCGLTQMISLRYGTVPIVRETGGLVDTVFDLDNSGLGLNDANGFTFRDPTTVSLKYGLERATRLWYDNPEAFNRLAHNGMRYDYSWRHPTEHYENIYNYIKA